MAHPPPTDIGLTHIALPVSDMQQSVEFYAKFCDMEVVHRRSRESRADFEVVWLSDGTRPFVVVLLQTESVTMPLAPNAHLGFACASRERVDQLCALAADEGRLLNGPHDAGPPVGYWAFIADPDRHTVELSFGQQTQEAVRDAFIS